MRDGEVSRLARRIGAMRGPLLAVALVFAGTACLAAPAPRGGQDPDWPCQQRLMPTLGGGALWSGPPLDGVGDWHSDPAVAELVGRIAPRSVSTEAGVAAIGTFADQLPPTADKRRQMTLVFAGLLDETNRERSDIIARLKALGRRQHELADIASQAGEKLRKIPADATGDAAAQRSDLEQRFTFVTQAFENTQRTMRYACEAPAKLEGRLGRYAQAVKDRL
jgi:hypothetical protein